MISPHPFHPRRLLDELESLGSGPFRTRGCFWLPTRPGSSIVWDGAGGHLSLDTYDAPTGGTPQTRLLFTGLGTPPPGLRETFESLLDTDRDAARRPCVEDGFEPWLGEIRSVA